VARTKGGTKLIVLEAKPLGKRLPEAKASIHPAQPVQSEPDWFSPVCFPTRVIDEYIFQTYYIINFTHLLPIAKPGEKRTQEVGPVACEEKVRPESPI
jgi:hypothetical protein